MSDQPTDPNEQFIEVTAEDMKGQPDPQADQSPYADESGDYTPEPGDPVPATDGSQS